jgi:hypothetical protein
MSVVVGVGLISGFILRDILDTRGFVGISACLFAAMVVMTAAMFLFLCLHPCEKEPNQAPEPTAPSGRGSS